MPAYPLDMLGAETDGLIGYLLEQEIGNVLGPAKDRGHAADARRGRGRRSGVRRADQTDRPGVRRRTRGGLQRERGWTMARDGDGWRRVVPSPAARELVDARPIGWLLERGAVVVCGGGGGIPVVRNAQGQWHGVEAVIDKDDCAALIAERAGCRCADHRHRRRWRV